MSDDERFDGLYLNVAQTTKGIEPLLDTVFSFLRRKTDFFNGPDGEQGAVTKVNQVLQKHLELHQQNTKKQAPKKPKKNAPKPQKVSEPGVLEMNSDGTFDASLSLPPPTKKQAPASTTAEPTESSSETGKGPPPMGNGGTVPGKYVWTQLLSEVVVTVPLPEHTRGKDLKVVIAKQHLKVGLRTSSDLMVDADLCKPIVMDDSFWTVEDGNKLVINLQKLNQMEWWDCVCKGDPTINVQDIQPESSSLGDLDGETRKTVEKMMFDQRQKAMGLPSSDEQQKLDMLEKFKQHHPEMDFSNAKIS